MKKIVLIIVAMSFLGGCYGYMKNEDVQKEYVQHCKDIEVEGEYKSRRRWRVYKRTIRTCKVCNSKGNCWWQDEFKN